ncbi:hypothetical protein BDW42DRAFT_160635 [Aspergillus taichungensis]|uniref:Uncharacterized protein n=1 Tax=Aspergillus taichungensis TaxID=482145 RepID=A0A2J5I6C9_9EURO|nr:hypothetical protein BDW42DRAFT_160635 [Aspergillus taichungensis]
MEDHHPPPDHDHHHHHHHGIHPPDHDIATDPAQPINMAPNPALQHQYHTFSNDLHAPSSHDLREQQTGDSVFPALLGLIVFLLFMMLGISSIRS